MYNNRYQCALRRLFVRLFVFQSRYHACVISTARGNPRIFRVLVRSKVLGKVSGMNISVSDLPENLCFPRPGSLSQNILDFFNYPKDLSVIKARKMPAKTRLTQSSLNNN